MAIAMQSVSIDEGQSNWMTSAMSLSVVRDVLGPEIKKEIDAIHSTLKQNPPTCGICKTKDMKFNKGKKLWEINCVICQPWVTEVSKQHASKTEQNVYKENSDMKRWPVDSWEIAKFYMPKGQGAQNTGPETSDCAALLTLMCNCTKFDKKNIKLLQSLLTVRNNTFHCSSLTLDKKKMEANINKMISVIQQIFPNSTQQAVNELKKMRDGQLVLPGEKLLAAKIEVIDTRLAELITKVEESNNSTGTTTDDQSEKALVATMEFVLNSDERLKEELQPKIDQGMTLIKKMREDIEAMGSRMDEGEMRMSNVENRVEELNSLCTKFSGLRKTGAPVTVDYKGQLQNYTQKKQMDKPVYSTFPHLDGGFVGEVTVDKKTYETDEPCLKSVDAEKEAAKKALIELGLLRGVQNSGKVAQHPPGSMVPAPCTGGVGGGARPKDGMQGPSLTNNQTTFVIQPSKQSPNIENSVIKRSHLGIEFEVSCQQGENKWQATATFSAIGALQLPIQENNMSRKASEQALAQHVLDKLRITDTKGSSPKEKLHSYCGEKKKSLPKYVDEEKNQDGTFGCVVICEELNCREVVSLLGDSCQSQEDARKSVILKAETMIKALPAQSPSDLKTQKTENSSADLGTVKGSAAGTSSTEQLSNISMEFSSCQYPENHKWQTTAKFQVIGALQLPAIQNKASKQNSKQALAQIILEKFSIATVKGSSPSEELYSHCGKNKKQAPVYVDTGKDKTGTYGCVIVWESLKDKETILVVGDMCDTEEEAKKGAKCGAEEIIGMVATKIAGSIAMPSISANSTTTENASAQPQSTLDTVTNEASGVSLGCTAKKPRNPPTANRNCIGELNEILQKNKEFEKVSEESQKEEGKFQHLLKMKANNFKEFPERGYSSNKAADKHLALYILGKIYPDKVSDVDKAKNTLQEESVKVWKDNVPKYTSQVHKQGSDHQSSCSVMFNVVSGLFPDKMSAKQNAYKRVVDIIKPI